MTDKPPYRVPLMGELPEPGPFVVASTFAGGGGSSLGYRMAGLRVVWANEVVPEARACYLANAAPGTVVDGRDIREVGGGEILDAVEAATGSRELHLFDGSPPCMSFSTAGIRHKGWGKVSSHADGTHQVSDDLFFEYARLVRELRPWAFVAENVSGMVKGTAIGYFNRVLSALRSHGYTVDARLLDSQWLGVPQARQRLIFVGVREDLSAAGLGPTYPAPLPWRYSIRDALPNLQHANGLRLQRGPKSVVRTASLDQPSPTIAAAGVANVREYQATLPAAAPELDLDTDPENGYRISLDGHAIAPEWDKLRPGETSDRYFNLVRPHPDAPIPTVTASNTRRGVAGVTHPTQRRKLTLAELRRLCSFPDDFALPGTYQDGWARLGNAVPPVMMKAVAEAVRDRVLAPWAAQRDAAGDA